MEDKQCKQRERFSIMAKGSNYVLSLDDKSKQRCKVKKKNQIKKEELSGDISKYPPVQ